jgi:hypothetical protein
VTVTVLVAVPVLVVVAVKVRVVEKLVTVRETVEKAVVV